MALPRKFFPFPVICEECLVYWTSFECFFSVQLCPNHRGVSKEDISSRVQRGVAICLRLDNCVGHPRHWPFAVRSEEHGRMGEEAGAEDRDTCCLSIICLSSPILNT